MAWVWTTQKDSAVCPWCRQHEGLIVRNERDFKGKNKGWDEYPKRDRPTFVEGIPAHKFCRCYWDEISPKVINPSKFYFQNPQRDWTAGLMKPQKWTVQKREDLIGEELEWLEWSREDQKFRAKTIGGMLFFDEIFVGGYGENLMESGQTEPPRRGTKLYQKIEIWIRKQKEISLLDTDRNAFYWRNDKMKDQQEIENLDFNWTTPIQFKTGLFEDRDFKKLVMGTERTFPATLPLGKGGYKESKEGEEIYWCDSDSEIIQFLAESHPTLDDIYNYIRLNWIETGPYLARYASEIAFDMKGDCTEVAVLTNAIARAQGRNAKVVTGWLVVETGVGAPITGYHAWNIIDGQEYDGEFGGTHPIGEREYQQDFPERVIAGRDW